MILDGNVFRAWSKLWTLSYLDATRIVLKNLAMKFVFRVEKLKYSANFLHQVKERKSFPHCLRKGNVLSFSCAEGYLSLELTRPGDRASCVHNHIACPGENYFRIIDVA